MEMALKANSNAGKFLTQERRNLFFYYKKHHHTASQLAA